MENMAQAWAGVKKLKTSMKNLNTFDEFLNESLNEDANQVYSELSSIVQKYQGKEPLFCAIALTNHLMQTMDRVKMNRKENDDIVAMLQNTLKKLNGAR